MIYEIKLSIKDYATLYVYTSLSALKDKLIQPNSQIKRTIPITKASYLEVTKNDIKYDNAIIIAQSNEQNMYYDKEHNVSFLYINDENIRFPDLVYIALSMFSKILAEQKKYLLHSSSLQLDNNGIVLVGDANAGKTSLAYEMMSKHNCKLISNDHSIIGIQNKEPMILGGTKEIQMRLGAIELYFPELYEKINIKVKDKDKWNKKIVINDLIDSNLILENNEEVALKNIYSISTTNSLKSFIRKKDDIDEFLFLYESLSKIIKGTYNYITGFNYPMPSMENEKILFDLSDVCKKIVNHCSVSEAKGGINDLARELVKKYEK